ncbi:MAG: tetratricopeptide repeat protein, partial [bacterium]
GPQAVRVRIEGGDAEPVADDRPTLQRTPTEAVEAYRGFIRTHPKDARVDRAQLMIGECFDRAGDSRAARAAYGLVVANYPDSIWVPAARSRMIAIDAKP